MATPQEKIYKPINGDEAVDLILTEFHRQLVNSGLFPLHRTWHEFEIVGGVRVKGWSTRTEEVKFAVSQPPEGMTVTDDGAQSYGWQGAEGRVDVRLGPGPPDLLRETLEKFLCPKCGRESGSKAGNLAHLRWCKAEDPREPPLVIEKQTPEGDPVTITINSEPTVFRVTDEPDQPESPAA